MDKQSAPRTNVAIADDLERWFREVHETLPPTPARHAIEALRKGPPVLPAEVEALIKQGGRVCEARGHGGLWPSKENCIVCALATLLRRYAQAVAEKEAEIARLTVIEARAETRLAELAETEGYVTAHASDADLLRSILREEH